MKHSWKVGFNFGLTSGVITTLGLMIGLNASTHSKMVVLGGILTIAIADALSDAMGIHVSEESENKHSHKEIWQSTISTFIFKLLFALTFIIPVLLFQLPTAIIVSLVWGFLAISIMSYFMAKKQKKKPWFPVLEHIALTAVVVILTHLIGMGIAKIFGGI
jgi:vacuolar iron transporter family protein